MSREASVNRLPEDRLRALCALSNVSAPLDVSRFVSRIRNLSDPETAVRMVLSEVPSASEVLTRHWRNLVIDIWTKYHPKVPIMPHWALSAADVEHTPVLNDARALLAELAQRPVKMCFENKEWLIDANEVMFLARLLPSLGPLPVEAVENEWNIPQLRRLRAILQAARLVRVVKGQLVPVVSRVRRFNNLPSPLQFYVLWHADVYHVDWADFAGLWHKYMRLIQEYIPILWETLSGLEAGKLEDRALWAVSVLEAFTPLWDEEGLLDLQKGPGSALQIVQQHALPSIVDRFLLRDLFERHSLVTITEEFGTLSKFSWTQASVHALTAEDTQIMPCGNNLLDRQPQLIADLSR